MNLKISVIASLLCLGLAQSSAACAEEAGGQSKTVANRALKQTIKPAFGPYGYPLPQPAYGQLGRAGWPNYGPTYYPVDQQRFNSRNRQRFNGRNDWFGDNRMNHWNRVVSDMVTDMFGDGAGDFDFDVNIKFKARGKGKGKAKGRGDADAERYSSYRTEQNYRGRGGAYGHGDTRQQTGLGRYNGFNPYSYPYYPPYPAYVPGYRPPSSKATPAPVTTYPSYPPVSPANAAEKNR